MNITMLVGPLVGAVIGYCTNYIAVRMLFRPLKEKRIGKFRVPFTPGIIPKEQGRMAKAIGTAVGNTLITTETLEKTLLTDDMKNTVKSEIDTLISSIKKENDTINTKALKFMERDALEHMTTELTEGITDRIHDSLIANNIGGIVAEQVTGAMKNAVEGSLVAMFVNDSMLMSFSEPITNKINEYIEMNARGLILNKVNDEKDKVLEMQVSEVAAKMEGIEIDISSLAVDAYEKFIREKLSGIIEKIDFANIVESKINDMDVIEVEHLLLDVMQKELNAIVNLGALIGLILGIIMIFIR